MGSTSDKISGKANELAGKAKQAIGDATDNHSMEAKGAAQEAKGHGQQAKGEAKDAVKNVVDKAREVNNGADNLMVCERGASFGYNALVSDMRSLPIMAETGYPVVFDATHSVQQPGGQGELAVLARRISKLLQVHHPRAFLQDRMKRKWWKHCGARRARARASDRHAGDLRLEHQLAAHDALQAGVGDAAAEIGGDAEERAADDEHKGCHIDERPHATSKDHRTDDKRYGADQTDKRCDIHYSPVPDHPRGLERHKLQWC